MPDDTYLVYFLSLVTLVTSAERRSPSLFSDRKVVAGFKFISYSAALLLFCITYAFHIIYMFLNCQFQNQSSVLTIFILLLYFKHVFYISLSLLTCS